MLRSNSKKFNEKLQALIIDTINNEDGASTKENLQITLDNLKACYSGNWQCYPFYQRPAILSPASVKDFIQGCGGFFEYAECKQIEELASLYCENVSEELNYIERWQRVLDKKGYEPILEHYAYIISKGLARLVKEYEMEV